MMLEAESSEALCSEQELQKLISQQQSLRATLQAGVTCLWLPEGARAAAEPMTSAAAASVISPNAATKAPNGGRIVT